ncbi:hypothetical protein ACIP10_36550 [Streptomyces galbus]|uniref:hypothetical protein n=1 Tax=Streptomyces galbus TaxID=33898 RepID=UPI0037F5118D
MYVNAAAMMGVVIVFAFSATALARGRWSGPWWLVVLGAVLTYPVSYVLIDRLENVPGGWLRQVFQVSCGMLAAVLLAPVYHWLRPSDRGAADREAARPVQRQSPDNSQQPS